MFFDGSLNINGAGAGILFISLNKDKLRYIIRILFPASNNVTEYEACLHGIRLAVELGIKRLYVYGDSALVINQLNKEWDTTHEKMDLYCKEIRRWESNFYGIEYFHVVWDKNQAADVSVFSPRGVTPTSKFVCMLPFPDGDAKRHKDLSWFGQEKAHPAGEGEFVLFCT